MLAIEWRDVIGEDECRERSVWCPRVEEFLEGTGREERWFEKGVEASPCDVAEDVSGRAM